MCRGDEDNGDSAVLIQCILGYLRGRRPVEWWTESSPVELSLVQLSDMQESLESLVTVLESYRGRDKVVSIYLSPHPALLDCWTVVGC